MQFNSSLPMRCLSSLVLIGACAAFAHAEPVMPPDGDRAAADPAQGLVRAEPLAIAVDTSGWRQDTLARQRLTVATPTPQPSAAGASPNDASHCWWACYPGSGCEYICRFSPQ